MGLARDVERRKAGGVDAAFDVGVGAVSVQLVEVGPQGQQQASLSRRGDVDDVLPVINSPQLLVLDF